MSARHVRTTRPLVAVGLALAVASGTPARAQVLPSDGVASSGILSDADFQRLATCGAPPGGNCRGPVLRWPKPHLTLRLAQGEDSVPAGFEARLMPTIRSAIREINAAGAGISISLTNAAAADITVRPTIRPEGAVLPNEPGISSAGIMGVGYMTIWSDDRDQIVEASILISTSITDDDLPSVMLEEVTQSLGAIYDIENPAYEGVSILSQTSNATTTISGQDAALLRWLYPTWD